MNPSHPPAPAGRVWFVLGLLALFAIVSAHYSVKAINNRGAFNRWIDHVLTGVENGEGADGVYNYPNPPVMALVLYPFAKLPAPWGALAWFYLKVGLTLLSLRWIFRLVESPDKPLPLWARVATVLLAVVPVVGDLEHGNVNLFILFLVVAALTALRCKRGMLCGLLIGLAVACKVTPALFIPYFLWKRQWRVLAGCAAGLLLFLWPGFVPALALGWQENQRQTLSWYNEMVYPYVVQGRVTSEHNNQSLPGLVARLLTHSASFFQHDEAYTPIRYDNLLSLTSEQARWIVKGCMALFALAVVWRCRTPMMHQPAHAGRSPAAGDWRLAAEFSVVLLGMLLFSERTWKHHCVTLLLPFAVICYYLATQQPGRWLRGSLIGVLAASALLMLSTSTGVLSDDSGRGGAVTDLLGKQAQVYGAFVWMYVILTAALMMLLGRSRAPETIASVPPLHKARAA